MSIDLPNHLVAHVPHRELMLSLAIGMYATQHFTLGQAAELSGLSQGELQRELGRHLIATHYDQHDLQQDLDTVNRLLKQTESGSA